MIPISASAPVVACADAAAAETGAPDEACPPGMRANDVCMLSADFCACTPVVACAAAAVDFCSSALVVACAAAAAAATGAPDETCPPGMRANALHAFGNLALLWANVARFEGFLFNLRVFIKE